MFVKSDVLDEVNAGDRLSCSQAAKTIPGTTTEHPSGPTVFRWCVDGARASDGKRVRLEHVRVGSRILTSRAAVSRFLSRLTNGAAAPINVRTPKQRQQAAEKAGRELAAEGW